MKLDRIDLYKYFNLERPDGANGYLDCYIRERKKEFSFKRFRPAMLVIPGGGYGMLSDREREPIVMHYLNNGYQAFCLEYSLRPIYFPYQLLEGCMAICYIRENADELGVDKCHVGAIGFSAGGHLCAMLATICNDKAIKDFLGERVNLCRPDAVILSYPVIVHNEFENKGSIDNISGNKEELKQKLSLEKRVDKNSAPAFIWTTVTDEMVPCENSLMMAMAYRKAQVPFELHIFEEGRHGLALCNKETCWISEPVEKWIQLSDIWLKNMGFEIKD